MNIQDPRSPAVVTATIYAITKVTLYLIGVIWPNAAPHAQFVSDTLVPLVIIFAVYYVSKAGSATPSTTRGLAMDSAAAQPTKLQQVLLTLISPVLYVVGALFGLIIFFTQQPGPGDVFGSKDATNKPIEPDESHD